ncbi:MAG: ChaN family lipoprotein [Acidobacteriota bacterium]
MLRNIVLCALVVFYLSPFAMTQSAPSYVPHRVFDSKDNRFSDFEAMMIDLARADVVFVGEQHDDTNTHRLELALLEGIARRRSQVTVAMEMFERDTQSQVDDYLAGRISEADFLKASRPWPNYNSDYRPLIEFAKSKNWRVIAANVPRRLASQVSRSGLTAIDSLPAAERAFAARQIDSTKDDYFKRFAETMKSHPRGSLSESEMEAMTDRFYQAQCVKDDTMAESVAAAMTEPRPLVVHFNGAFHSDYRLGTAARAKKRLPDARIRIVSIVPLADLDQIKTGDYRKRGDFIVFTLGKKSNR